MKKLRGKSVVGIMLALAVCSMLGCNNRQSSYTETATENGYSKDYSYDEIWEEEELGIESSYENSTSQTQVQDTSRKLIKTASLNVETKEFDKTMKELQERVKALGGYIEYMDNYNGSKYNGSKSVRYASMTARIPAANLDAFLDVVAENGNITQKNEQVDDVTLTYVDVESRKTMLRTEEERLLSYLEQAENIEEIITIEDRLTDIRYEIESIESRLRTYDNQVDYSTVDLHITEVEVFAPQVEVEKTAWDRMTEGFSSNIDLIVLSVQEFFIMAFINLPFILLLLLIPLIAFIVYKIASRSIRKATQNNAQPQNTELPSQNAGPQNQDEVPESQITQQNSDENTNQENENE